VENEKKEMSPILAIEKEPTRKKKTPKGNESGFIEGLNLSKVQKQLTCILMSKIARFTQEMMGNFIQKY